MEAISIFGSTVSATAGPDSKIHLLVHFMGRPQQRKELEIWLRGWSTALAEMNHLRTGIRTDSRLDVHFASGGKIVNKTSIAAKLNLLEEGIQGLPLGNKIAK